MNETESFDKPIPAGDAVELQGHGQAGQNVQSIQSTKLLADPNSLIGTDMAGSTTVTMSTATTAGAGSYPLTIGGKYVPDSSGGGGGEGELPDWAGDDAPTDVAVTAVALNTDPSSINIGDTLHRSDFTISTNPQGYGNYQSADGSYLVQFPQNINVQVGDNPATATCGESSATLTLVGVTVTADWNAVEDYDRDQNQVKVSYTAEVDGDTDTTAHITFSGLFTPERGDTNPTLTPNQQFNGAVWLHMPVSGINGSANEKLKIEASEESTPESNILTVTGRTNPGGRSQDVQPRSLNQGLDAAKQIIGKLSAIARMLASFERPVVHPLSAAGNGITLDVGTIGDVSYVNANGGDPVFSASATAKARFGGRGLRILQGNVTAVGSPEAEVIVIKGSMVKNVRKVMNGGGLGPPEKIRVGAENKPQGSPTSNGVIAGTNPTFAWTHGQSAPGPDVSDDTATADCVAPSNGWKLHTATMRVQLQTPAINGNHDSNWGHGGNAGEADDKYIHYDWFP